MVNFPFGTKATKRMTSARMRAPALDFGMWASVRLASGRLQRFLRRTVPDDLHLSQTAAIASGPPDTLPSSCRSGQKGTRRDNLTGVLPEADRTDPSARCPRAILRSESGARVRARPFATLCSGFRCISGIPIRCVQLEVY